MKYKILIVDDDPKILASLRRSLTYEGFDVVAASDGIAAVDLISPEKPNLIVLDVMMPEMDGYEACRFIRDISEAPILMLTARDEVSDKVKGLDSGADDYLVKPFAYEELLARIKALLRRTDKRRKEGTILSYGDLSLDVNKRTAFRDEKSIELSTKEFELLYLFMTHPEEVLTREFLMDRVWGWDYEGESNVLEVYIRYLRAKVDNDKGARLIHTVRGAGYTLKKA